MDYIILDDDLTAMSILEQLCSTQDDLNQVGTFSSPIDAIKFLNERPVDLIFLDIHMPHFSGFDFIKTIKIQPKIILSTADPEFAFKAFGYNSIIDYLVKPVTVERFSKALSKLRVLSAHKKTVEFIELED